MTHLGTIAEIWRFPVKSMAGERLDCSVAGPAGLAGDRGWAVRDEQAGEIRGAKQLPKLLMCAARYLEEPEKGSNPHVEISLPDGSRLRTDKADDAHKQLSAFLGRPVTLWPLQPASNDAHYRRSRPLDSEAAVREFLSRERDEDLPELSQVEQFLLQEITEFSTPRGTYFDVPPITSSPQPQSVRWPQSFRNRGWTYADSGPTCSSRRHPVSRDLWSSNGPARS